MTCYWSMQEVEVEQIHMPFKHVCWHVIASMQGVKLGQIHVSIKAFIYHMFGQRIKLKQNSIRMNEVLTTQSKIMILQISNLLDVSNP